MAPDFIQEVRGADHPTIRKRYRAETQQALYSAANGKRGPTGGYGLLEPAPQPSSPRLGKRLLQTLNTSQE
jgi:hypothetical protein